MADKSASRKPQKTAQGAPKPKKKRKKTTGQKIVLILLIAVVVAAVVFLAVCGILAWQVLGGGETKPEADLSVFDTTPVGLQDKVAYYVFALEGAEEGKPFDALAILCHDKQAKTLQVLQVPVATYVGEGLAVETIGLVWDNPNPLKWCQLCGRDVPQEEVQGSGEAATHILCGNAVTEKTGSAAGDLMSVFNDQMGLPVDQYFIMPQAGFVELVDTIGGIDVTLDAKWKFGEVTYPAGVQTLGGAAALEYITNYEYKSTPDSDIARIVRSRKVFAALIDKVRALESNALRDILRGTDTYHIFGLQTGKNAIRTNNGSATEDINQIVGIFAALRNMTTDDMVFYLLPGRSTKVGKLTCYSMNRAELTVLLQEHFNPYGEPVTEGDLGLTEIGGGKANDSRRATFTECLPATPVTPTTTT